MLNSRLNDKLNIFDEIDKISKEITKQNSFKTTHYNSLYDTNNNSLNQQFNFANTQQYLNNNNNTINNNDFQNSFNNYISKNNKIENLKESFSTNVNKDIISSKKLSQEENPEKFVFQFFYDNQELTTDNKQKKTTGNKGSHNIKYFRQNKYNTNNRPYNDINNQLMNYKSMVSRCNNYSIKDKKNKSKENNNKINKIIINSFSAFNKFYTRAPIIFEIDYPSIIYSSCDIFYMLYNKMMDNICYNPNFLPYIEELDEYILTYFIKPCLNDLIKISELIIKDEVDGLNLNLEKLYK
jgi:hypothetical protein